jgi:hypothetical protein
VGLCPLFYLFFFFALPHCCGDGVGGWRGGLRGKRAGRRPLCVED